MGCRCDLKSKIKEMKSRVMTDDDMVEEESGNDIFFGVRGLQNCHDRGQDAQDQVTER